MDKQFFHRKIKELTDDKLIDLLQKTGNDLNQEVFELAKEEAGRRGLEFKLIDKADNASLLNESNDTEKLSKWNWGAFFLAPIWTLANKLEIWTILCFIPFVNIGVIFYLGYKGNRLAFEKSKIDSIDDFLLIQKGWGVWGLRLFWLGLIALIVGLVG
uniref:hypothetical protein n=1 Tax=Roseivirga sp. TaxID=1964215 RepID=UPI004047C2DA